MNVEGPMARSVADVAFYFAALSDPDQRIAQSL